MVNFRPKSLLITGRANGGIGHGTTHAHFFTTHRYTACHSGSFRQLLSRNRKLLYIVQPGVFTCGLAVNDTLCVADSTVDSHSTHGPHNGLADINIHTACYSQGFTCANGAKLNGVILTLQCNSVALQIGPSGVIKGVVGKGQPHGHSLSTCHLTSNINNRAGGLGLPTDVFPCYGIILKVDLGIILQIVPATGTGPVKGLAANGYTCSHGNNEGITGGFTCQFICRNGGAFNIRCNIVFHVVISNTCTCAYVLIPASAHGSSNGDAMVLSQLALGIVLVLGGIPRSLAFVGDVSISVLGNILV